MIKAAKYNGINFSDDFNRKSDLINYDNQRVRSIANRDGYTFLAFETDIIEPEFIQLTEIGKNFDTNFYPIEVIEVNDRTLILFSIGADELGMVGNAYFKLEIDGEVIYSEIYRIINDQIAKDEGIAKFVARNNDDTHGYFLTTHGIYAHFKKTELNRDLFISETTEYEYSYGRKMVLGSENQIAKRFTFHGLSMYQQNLLKWICKCENFFIDGVQYELISDFTELL